MLPRTAILVALSAILVPAAPKNRDWQTGTLLDPENNSYFGRGYSSAEDTNVTFSNGMTQTSFHSTSAPPANAFVFDHYVVASDTYVYLVQVMLLKSFKPFPLPVNMPVKFAVEKNSLWLLGADGSRLRTTIAKRKAKFQPTQ